MGEKMSEQIAVRMSAQTRLKLERLAKKEKRRITEMARLLIEKELDK